MNSITTQVVGLLLNIECAHVPYEINLAPGFDLTLTNEFGGIPHEALMQLSNEARWELEDRAASDELLALASNRLPGWLYDSSGFLKGALLLVLTAIRITTTPWVGMPLQWLAVPPQGRVVGRQKAIFGDKSVPVVREMDTWTHRWDIAERRLWGQQKSCILGGNDLSAVSNLVSSMLSLNRQPDSERRRFSTAIRRLDLAIDREQPEDAVVDLVIALEALFMSGEEGVRNALARRVTCYLEPEGNRREDLVERINQMVSASIKHSARRSRIR